jgi:hypothetical protein
LTPKVNGVATCRIPASGVQYSIDSGPLQPVIYGDARADIAQAFPGFANSPAAGGHAIIDWSALAPGAHTIGWLVTDDCNRSDGVGSRFFNVPGGSAVMAADVPSAIAAAPSVASVRAERESEAAITIARGVGELPSVLYPDADGVRIVDLKQGERIEMRVPRGFETAYQLGPDSQARGLPAGATWDAAAGTFYWQPAPGFLGAYRIVFSNGAERITVRVVVGAR